ncbi:MAG: hypothetical protein ACPL7K_08230 [Armatimonadota bacterium]
MARLGCLLAIIVMLVVAWDQYRIEQMRREIAGISSKLHVHDKKGAQKTDLVTVLAKTERHTRRAKELLRKKRFAEAQAELDRALAGLKAANAVSTDIVGDTADFLGAARDRAMKLFQDTWKQISQQARAKK